MKPLRVGSLFAGYGGLDLGVGAVLGAEPAWFAEYEAAPSKILAHHWPDVPNHGDVTRIDWAAVEPVDIITGGSPCQDMSHAGKRAGMKDGTRSGLWSNMRDAIATIQPRLVVWENVRGALSADADSNMEPCPGCVGGGDDGPVLRALGRVLGDLADIGYDAAWTGLRAADVGAPHGRFRVFVLAWPAADPDSLGRERAGITWDGRTRPADSGITADRVTLLPTPAVNDMGAGKTVDAWDAWTDAMQAKHGNGNGHGKSLSIEAARLLPSPTVSDGNGAGVHGDGGLDLRTAMNLLPTPRATRGGSATETVALLPTPKATNNENTQTPRQGSTGYGLNLGMALMPTPRATDGTKGGPNQRGSSGDLMLPSAVMLLPTPTSTDAKASGSTQPTTDTHSAGVTLTDATVRQAGRFGQYAPAIARWEAITRPAPSPTDPTGKAGAQRLSPRFCEWMMGLPEGWVTDVPGVSRNDQLKALGNGVVPQQCAAAVRHLLAVMVEVSA